MAKLYLVTDGDRIVGGCLTESKAEKYLEIQLKEFYEEVGTYKSYDDFLEDLHLFDAPCIEEIPLLD